MGIVSCGQRRRRQVFNRELNVPAGLHNALWNRLCDFDRPYESYAEHHRRRLIHRLVNFVVAGFRNVSGGDGRRVNDAHQQQQNKCPKAMPHLAPLLEVKIAKQRAVVNANMRMSYVLRTKFPTYGTEVGLD